MIEAKAIVTKIEADQVWIGTQQNSACVGCQQKMSCVTASVEEMFPKHAFKVHCPFPVEIGQPLKVGIDDAHLLSISALVYLLPLLLMFCGVLLANFMLPPAMVESWLPLIALSILLLAFRLINRRQMSLLSRLGINPDIRVLIDDP